MTPTQPCWHTPPDLDHAAVSLALDLHSGAGALLAFRPRQREHLLDVLESVLTSPPWAAVARADPADELARHRAVWFRRTVRQPFTRSAPGTPLRIEVVARDAAEQEAVETRVLLDGHPLG